ncbi:hypothetical protein Pla22_00610 [Rubripirellula amarantea]|uniref:DUF4350 domain-containing protein n=1 Tax=Rubripirellula amarantea TaxID=2527999 RepID=A0A5C5WPD7_9BACT|nr:hypothetical protein [Rubripirellula amarantea]TWT52437.1 hypothetical protein Pla22_00610 [Rubripirellula amarantea]
MNGLATDRVARQVLCLFGCALLLATGCNRFYTNYGESKSVTGRTSLNGFGGLRQAFEQNGFRSRDVSRLTERVRRTDVLVWTPKELGPIDTRSTRWFEGWLSSGNRTLVYILPDSGSETEYWQDAASLAPPNLRLEYRKRIAKSINQRMTWRTNRSAPPSNGWFALTPLASGRELDEVSGNWDVRNRLSDELKNKRIEFGLQSYDEKSQKNSVVLGGVIGGSGPTGPDAMGWTLADETDATTTKVKFRPKLKLRDGTVVVATVESERWRGSKVVVVAGGSLLTNYALTKSFGKELAAELVTQAKEPLTNDVPSVGFLVTGVDRLAVSERKPGAPVASGMELLTVWPISLVTIHGVLLGLVVCLMLFPIFGRARPGEEVDHSDFDDHLDSVAALMKKAGGKHFAKHRISEYHKRIRGETAGPWILPDQPSVATAGQQIDTASQQINTTQTPPPSAFPPQLP